MIESKKIIIVGPAGTGKTTIKKIFFEMANPLNLLKKSLEPSRGKTSSIYTLFDLNLGVFDLAGQENENWFNKDKGVFSQANKIICVLDINSYLKDIFNFLDKITKIYSELNLNDTKMVFLLHKIDLIDALYLRHKFKALNDYLIDKIPSNVSIKIYTTSIAKEFFFKTYDIMTELIRDNFENKLDFINKSLVQDFRLDLEIIIQYDLGKDYRIIDLFNDFKIPSNKANSHLTRLERLGFIKFLEDSHDFQLTERASFFKYGLEKQDDKQNKINKVLESLYLFSNLNLEPKRLSPNL